jgi:hypothetical protein
MARTAEVAVNDPLWPSIIRFVAVCLVASFFVLLAIRLFVLALA